MEGWGAKGGWEWCRVWRGGGGMRVVGSGVDGVEVESGGVEFSF